MKNLNITIISGGSGNDALVKGIKSIYKNANVKAVVNAYDSGKSTGICRAVTDTLGVSDIRKNHIRMYKAMHEHPDVRIIEFYDGRYDFTKGNEKLEIIELLDKWELSQLSPHVINFFENEASSDYIYKDFSVANIVYAQMYKEHGYKLTNKYFCELLGLDDFVILNSFDNVYIHAHLEDGSVLTDEGDLVELKDPNNKVVRIDYVGNKDFGLNKDAIDAVLQADLLIISTGTFWSSIYPTLEYMDFYKYINTSSAKKIWAINNAEDKDAYGVTSNDFINIVSDLGLDLTKFTILENTDAVESLRLPNNTVNVVYASMENHNGKHNGDKYARSVLRIYYNLMQTYDKILFDFDDTLWSRDCNTNPNAFSQSVKNIKTIANSFADKSVIISGNSYDSIKSKLYQVFGTNLQEFNVPIWADANSTLFVKDIPVQFIEELSIRKHIDTIVAHLQSNYGIIPVANDSERVACLKIKPLDSLTRNILCDYLNHTLLTLVGAEDCIAVKTGYTTIDIVNNKNNKKMVYTNAVLPNETALYIGDEISVGNDADIASMCNAYIQTSGAEETSVILNLLKEN